MMAAGNKRGSKRPSSTSTYTSTITTVVFIAMCVLGVWMLTSNTLGPPKDTATKLSSDKKDQITTSTVFQDNPGDLPTDAIQPDDPKQNDNAAAAGSAGSVVSGDGKEQDGGGGGKNEEAKVGELSVDEQVKQKEGQTQISEESTLTQNQQEVDQNQQKMTTSQDSQNRPQPQQEQQQQQQQQQKTNEDMTKQQLQEDAGKQQAAEISDEDKKKRVQQHDEEQKQIVHEPIQKQENPQNPEETNANPKELPTQQAMQTDVEQQTAITTTATTIQEPVDTSNVGSQNKKPRKNKRDRTKERKPATSTNTEEPVVEVTGTKPGIPKESTESKKSWSTQAKQSANEKERREDESKGKESIYGYTWHLCNESTGADFIPCLDNEKALKKLRSTRHYEHRERHCPEEGPTCLVPLPQGYKTPIRWPQSRDKIWYGNVPHSSLADVKGHQNWVKVTGEFLTFPGGGTQFIHGALHYIDIIQQAVPDIAWGKKTRVVLDVGCGVASFGGYLFDRDVLTMSFAPKDEHEAQVQFALERGIPAISAVMGTQRLPFPSKVFDLLHCARCRVPWHIEGGMLLLELNRVLRPGGYFVWSATPVYQKIEEDVEIWKAMSSLTVSMCWELVTIRMDKINSAGFAVYRKPITNECYDKRKDNNPPMCKTDDDPNAAWYVPLQACLHRLTVNEDARGSRWPEPWPLRLQTPPYWLNKSQMGIYGKPAPEDFIQDYRHWKRVVSDTYMTGLGISWSDVRNIMDMRAVYGGFAAALKDLHIPVWVMNVVNIDSPDTLPMIYERGLFGIYHDWCESFSTYPRTYDLLHADHLFSKLKKKCKLAPVMAEVDRIVRPGGKLIVRDESSAIGEVENLLKSLRWEVHLTFSKDQEGILSAQKGNWRPDTIQAAS